MKILSQNFALINANRQVNNKQAKPAATNHLMLKTLTKDTVSFSGAGTIAEKTVKAAINLSRKTIHDLPADLSGKRVFLKVDHNLPKGDDTRMVASLPTIQDLLRRKATIIIGTHIGDPYKLKDGKMGKVVSTEANAKLLQQYLNRSAKEFENVEVVHSPDITGPGVKQQMAELKPGQILYLENLRFNSAETGKGAVLEEGLEGQGRYKQVKVPNEVKESHAKALAELADIYVNDAFGAAHRDHASVTGITKYMQGPKVAGLLMDKEIRNLAPVLESPEHPFVAIIGGSKVSSKIPILTELLEKVDKLVVGGGMAHTFTMAKGGRVGKSIVEPEQAKLAKEIMAKAKAKGVELILPKDAVVADNFANDAKTALVTADMIPDNMMGLDIGPITTKKISDALHGAKTILWNGPVGVFEMPNFAKGTNGIAKAVADVTKSGEAKSIIGGGDTGKAIKASGVAEDNFTHISTGGGASLEMFEKNGNLPGIRVLDEK